MLTSVKIARRQSEIRQELAALANKADPTEDETRSMDTLDAEYRSNETRYRAALIGEDTERREAGAELENRSDTERAEILAGFEMRQVVLALDEGRALDGRTAEIVQEMRSAGGYRGIPVPLEALEVRAGETVAAGVPDPTVVRPIVDRLFASTVAARMGVQTISIPAGSVEWPVTTNGATAGWADGEMGNVPGPQVFETTGRALSPDHNFGVTMRVTRRALKQAGAGLEQAIRRDMANAISVGLDRAVFQGSGQNGEPLGIIAGAGDYGILETPVDAAASWSAFRAAVVRFMVAHTAAGAGSVRLMIRPEVWAAMDETLIAGTATSEWDRLVGQVGAANVVLATNALDAPAGSPASTDALLTTTAGGLPPAFMGIWGGVDVIRDPYTDAQSGGLRVTAITTADVVVARGVQSEVLTGIE